MEEIKKETVAEATEQPKETKKRTTKKVVAETATTEEVKQPAKHKTPRKKKETPDATIVLKQLTPKERAFEELKELGIKISKLESFLDGSTVNTLSKKQVHLLLKQEKYMKKYYYVLNKRLEIWEE